MYGERNVRTFEDIYRSKMTIYTAFSSVDYDNEEIKRLFSNSKKVMNDAECIHLLMRTDNAVCIMPSIRANYFVSENLNAEGKPIMKIAEPSFRFDYTALSYEKSSPYAEKMDKIIQYLLESGISGLWEHRAHTHRAQIHQLNKTSAVIIDDCLLTQLIIILFIGYFISTLIFMYEWIANRLKSGRRRIEFSNYKFLVWQRFTKKTTRISRRFKNSKIHLPLLD